jgi:hypothetical protein
MIHRNGNCFMGGALRPPEFALGVVDPARVRSFLDHAHGADADGVNPH